MFAKHELLPAMVCNGLVYLQSDPSALKRESFRHGVNNRGWRLYVDYGDAVFAPLIPAWINPEKPYQGATNAFAWLKVLQSCEMDVLPPVELVTAIKEWGISSLKDMPPMLLRAAWKAVILATYMQQDLIEFVRNEVTPVMRWIFSSGAMAALDVNSIKAGWPSLSKKYRETLPVGVRYGQDWDPVVNRIRRMGLRGPLFRKIFNRGRQRHGPLRCKLCQALHDLYGKGLLSPL